MTTPTPTSGQSSPSGQPSTPKKEDFIQKHGKRIVVIIFCIFIGDALPTIIQNGLNPDKLFYTIVLMTLPYTGSLILIFLFWRKNSSWTKGTDPHTAGHSYLLGTALILSAGFVLGYYTHWWGFGNIDITQIHPWFNLLPDSCTNQHYHQYHYNKCNPRALLILGLIQLIVLFIQFYVTTYGLPTFIAATLASFVVTWDILKWMEK